MRDWTPHPESPWLPLRPDNHIRVAANFGFLVQVRVRRCVALTEIGENGAELPADLQRANPCVGLVHRWRQCTRLSVGVDRNRDFFPRQQRHASDTRRMSPPEQPDATGVTMLRIPTRATNLTRHRMHA